MTSAPFTTRTENYTFSELVADIALCRKVLRDGYFNGFPLDSETEVEWRDWLSDFEVEAEMRTERQRDEDFEDEAEDGAYRDWMDSRDDDLPLSNAA